MADLGEAVLSSIGALIECEHVARRDRGSTYETLKSRTCCSTLTTSGRPLEYMARVPAQQLYCSVFRVPAAPSMLHIGSV